MKRLGAQSDLAAAFLAWGGYAYGGGAEGVRRSAELFDDRLRRVEAVLHNQDNREHDLLDFDDYYQFEGGLAAAVETFRGAGAAVYHNDHSRPENPQVRTLDEEIARVVRGRVVNPKWIAGRDASRLQGRLRDGGHGRLPVRLRRDHRRRRRDHHFDAALRRLSRR